MLMSQPVENASLTSNDFATNLCDIEVTLVTVVHGSIVMWAY